MDLDQRRCFRKKRALQVRLLARSRARLGRTLDISLNGAFVEMPEPALLLPTTVEAVFRFPHQGTYHEHSVLTQVVRVTRQGVALRFFRYDGRAYASLMNLLYAA